MLLLAGGYERRDEGVPHFRRSRLMIRGGAPSLRDTAAAIVAV